MTARLHRHVYSYPHARPFGEGGVSQVVKNEHLDGCLSDPLLYLRMDHVTLDRSSVIQGKDVPTYVRHYGPGSLLGPDLFDYLPRLLGQRRYLLDSAFLSSDLGLRHALPFIDHRVGEPEQIALRQAGLFPEFPDVPHPGIKDRQDFLLFILGDLPAAPLGTD